MVNRKTVRRVLKVNNPNLPASNHRGRTKSLNLIRLGGPDQLWETDITYIPTESGMTYLKSIKDFFTKEWLGYNYSRFCMTGDAVRSMENAVLLSFNGSSPHGIVLRTDNGPQ
jgi:hypothetical protein